MTGEELKKARIRSGITQERLGLLLGYSIKSAERTVQLWEHGDRPIPPKHWRELAKILRVPLDNFIP